FVHAAVARRGPEGPGAPPGPRRAEGWGHLGQPGPRPGRRTSWPRGRLRRQAATGVKEKVKRKKQKQAKVNLSVDLAPAVHARLRAVALARSVREQRVVGMARIARELVEQYLAKGGTDGHQA